MSLFFFFSSRRRHTRCSRDWSSDVCSSDLAQQIAPNNGSVTFSNLSATGHSVALSGFPANCTVTSANPQSVNVPAGGTATVAFKVSCTATATTGTLTIATSTMGQNLPASYTVTATGPSFPTGTSESIGANEIGRASCRERV